MMFALTVVIPLFLSSVDAFSTLSSRNFGVFAKQSSRLTNPSMQQIPSSYKPLRVTPSYLQSTSASVADVVEVEQLSRPARSGRPLKVAIAGGGVGGLTTALCLLKKGIDVTVYEKTAAFARFGGPIQFASNALSVLKAIDDTLFTRVMEKFTFTGTRVCGIKDGLRADGSFRMTNDSLDYLWNPSAPADWFVKFPLKVWLEFCFPYCSQMCTRLTMFLCHSYPLQYCSI
jgi:hypothetical protein